MSGIVLDQVDRCLLQALIDNSRASASELGKHVGLTRQAVADRLERLRSEGVIRGFTLALAPEKVGITVRAYMAITLMPTCTEAAEQKVIQLLQANPWVQECYRVTGEDYFQIRVVAPGIEVLKDLVLALRATHVVQGTRTLLALETLFEKGAICLSEALLCAPNEKF